MSESMVERVAKAKWARRQEVARKAGISPPLADWDNELESLREEVRAETRAGIAAMREPTDAMCEAAEWHQQSDVNAYQDAIGAALTPAKVDEASR